MPILSSRDFTLLLINYARQVAGGNAASFVQSLGFDFLTVNYLGCGGIRLTLDAVVTLIPRPELSVRGFLDGKATNPDAIQADSTT